MAYEFAGASDRSIEEIKRLSLWELSAVRSGWLKMNFPEESASKAPSLESFRAFYGSK